MIVEKKHLGTAKDNTGICYLKRKVGIQCILDNKLCKKLLLIVGLDKCVSKVPTSLHPPIHSTKQKIK